MTKIAIAGAGYVGLANAVMLARSNRVCLLDIVPSKVDCINRGASPIADPDIERYLADGGLDLHATLDDVEAYADAEVAIISTPTDYDERTHAFDTRSVELAYKAIRSVNSSCTIVIKSTVPIGYTKKLSGSTGDDALVFSPEFLREGKALYDCLHPSRIIVGHVEGGSQTRASEVGRLLSAGAVESGDVLIMRAAEAEAVKLFANTYLALRVSYFNELDTFAMSHGLDTNSIIEGVCLDPRIGNFYNNPSFGYGGYCLPKDTKQLLANYCDVPQNLIQAIVDSNQTRIEFIAKSILKSRPTTVGIYRLTMKAASDNFRQSSIRQVIDVLRKSEVRILVYEPLLKEEIFEGLEVENNFEAFVARCDVIAANRMTGELLPERSKVFTCDLFGRD